MPQSKFVDEQQHAQQQQYPDTAEFLTDEEGDEQPGITGQGVASQHLNEQLAKRAAEEQEDMPMEPLRRTAFHKILTELWGQPEVADFLTARLATYMDLDSAEKTKNGFKIKTQDGNTVKWGITQNPDGSRSEAITASKLGFNQNTADSIIAVAMTHGWRSIKVSGKQAHKEMMWLAVQRHAMAEQKDFEMRQKLGEIPADAKYQPPTVTNFHPPEDSAVYQTYLKERAAFDAEREEAQEDPDAPKITRDDTAPTQEAKPEEKKPDSEKPQTAAPEKDILKKKDGTPVKNPKFEESIHRNEKGQFAKGDVTKEFNTRAPRDEAPKQAPAGTEHRQTATPTHKSNPQP